MNDSKKRIHPKLKVIRSLCNDPVVNIGYEAFLTESVKEDEVLLFLWQNDNTIVIGRNQNPWKECQVEKFKEDGGRVIRRLSGGGAVYHDMGNLNFSIIAQAHNYDVLSNIEVIKNGMEKLGFDARFSGKNDLTIDGRKFSGHAYFESYKGFCHHGAILVSTNLSKLSEYLTPSKLKLQTKSVDSVKARVVNLSNLNENINVKEVEQALISAFITRYSSSINVKEVDEKVMQKKAKDHISELMVWSWTFAECPKFSIELQNRFLWGTVDIGMTISNEVIQNFSIYTDSNEVEYFQELMSMLSGIRFDKKIGECKIRQYQCTK